MKETKPLSPKPTPTPAEAAMQASAAALRIEFRRRHFSEREHLLLDWILDFSLVCGRCDMTSPTLEALGQLAHMSRSNVHQAIHSLELMRVLSVERQEDRAARYRINPKQEEWLCRPRLSREELRFAISTLREANLLPAAALPLEVFFPAAVPGLGTVTDKGVA